MVEQVRMSITGEFVTNALREQFWVNNLDYDRVLEIGLNAVVCDELSVEERTEIVNNILLNKGEMIGSTADGSYTYEDCQEGNHINLFKKINELQSRVNDLQETLEEMTNKCANYEEQLGIYDEQEEESCSSPLVSEFLKADKHDDNYGWITPMGEFIPVEWGDHQNSATDLIQKYGFQDEFIGTPANVSAADFLVDKHGWILLHSPAMGIARPTFNEERRMTIYQKQFLKNYYEERDEYSLIDEYGLDE